MVFEFVLISKEFVFVYLYIVMVCVGVFFLSPISNIMKCVHRVVIVGNGKVKTKEPLEMANKAISQLKEALDLVNQ